MAITITATVGSATANSFVDEAAFIAYVAARPNAHSGATTSGSTATEAEKAALVQATRELSTLEWKGSRVDATQALSWPRTYCPNPDAPFDADALTLDDIIYFSETVIPSRVEDATCEVAIAILKAGTTDLSALPAADGVIRKKVDVLETEYAAPHLRAQGIARFPLAHRRIAPLLASVAGGLRVARS